MNTYTIYLGATPIADVSGTEYAYEAYTKTKELAELLGKTCALVWDETAEEVASYDPEEGFEYELDDVDECGFDPYAGCYTYDC
jgi:hypothetical protein